MLHTNYIENLISCHMAEIHLVFSYSKYWLANNILEISDNVCNKSQYMKNHHVTVSCRYLSPLISLDTPEQIKLELLKNYHNHNSVGFISFLLWQKIYLNFHYKFRIIIGLQKNDSICNKTKYKYYI